MTAPRRSDLAGTPQLDAGAALAGNTTAAGPTRDRALGIMVFRHVRRQEVDEICSRDPFVRGGYREYDVIPWDVHRVLGIGGFDLRTITAMTEAEELAEITTQP